MNKVPIDELAVSKLKVANLVDGTHLITGFYGLHQGYRPYDLI